MTDPTLAAVQARAIAVCVAGAILAVGGGVSAWACAAFADWCDAQSGKRSVEDVARATVILVCAPAFFVGMILLFVYLPDAVAPLPAQEAPK